MDLKIMWQQEYDFTGERGKMDKPIWHDFDNSDLIGKTRNEVIAMFSLGTAVIARIGNVYITNRPELQKKYRSEKKDCRLFSELEPSEKSLSSVGFI